MTDRYIAELLYDHDCVIIPGFGGFIGNYMPAKIHSVNHTFLPPSKTILFNINLKQNDGLLASRISFREQIFYEEAMQNIQEMVEEWNRRLKEQNTLIIEQVGKLIRKKEGNIQFIQEMSLNFLSESFGLTSFVSPAIRRAGFQEKMEKKISRYMEAPKTQRRLVPKPLKWAAVLMLPIGIATYFGITNFNSIRDLAVNYSGLIYSRPAVPVKSTVPLPSTIELKSAVANSNTHELLYPGIQPSRDVESMPPLITASPVTSVTPVEEASVAPETNKPYAIIVGAFRLRENADHLIASLRQKGYDAAILDTTRTGLYRVCIGTFDGQDEALLRLEKVRSEEMASAWILKR